MKLDEVIELISLTFSQTFTGQTYNTKEMTTCPPASNSQTMFVTDYDGNKYRIEISKV